MLPAVNRWRIAGTFRLRLGIPQCRRELSDRCVLFFDAVFWVSYFFEVVFYVALFVSFFRCRVWRRFFDIVFMLFFRVVFDVVFF